MEDDEKDGFSLPSDYPKADVCVSTVSTVGGCDRDVHAPAG